MVPNMLHFSWGCPGIQGDLDKLQQHPLLQVHPKLGALVLLQDLTGSYEWRQVLLAGFYPPFQPAPPRSSPADSSPQTRKKEEAKAGSKRLYSLGLWWAKQQQTLLWAESPHWGCPERDMVPFTFHWRPSAPETSVPQSMLI